VGVTDDVVRELTEHQRGTRLQWGGRLDDRARWWGDVVHVTVEHLPAGTTEWEAKVYGRSQLALAPLYNMGADGEPEPVRAARQEAEQRDAERHDRARQLHARHDGVTRLVRPTLSIVPRFPSSSPVPPAPAHEPAPATGAHDARRLPIPSVDPLREPVLAGSRSGRPGPADPGPTEATPKRLPSGAPAPGALADGPDGAVATATWPGPTAPTPVPGPEPGPDGDAGDRSLEHQGRYLLLVLAGMFLGIVLLSLDQVLR